MIKEKMNMMLETAFLPSADLSKLHRRVTALVERKHFTEPISVNQEHFSPGFLHQFRTFGRRIIKPKKSEL